MSSWETNVTKSTFNAGEKIGKQMEGRKRDHFKGGTGYNTLEASDFYFNDSNGFDLYGTGSEKRNNDGFVVVNQKGEYNIIGINGSQVPNMREAINTYTDNIQKYLEDAISATQEKLRTGFRGTDAEKAVKEYLDKVKAYVYNLVSTLDAFSDKLADVGNAWIKAQSNIASTVNTSKGNFSEGSAYVENVQYQGASSAVGFGAAAGIGVRGHVK